MGKCLSVFSFFLPFSVSLLLTASVRSQDTTNAQAEPEITRSPDEAPPEPLPQLTLRQKVGQLFIFGFNGTNMEEGLEGIVSRHQPGGIIVFGRNITSPMQIARLNYKTQMKSIKGSKVPAFIAVDQEGGNVVRIKTIPPLPSALALAETQDMELVRAAGANTGKLLRALGFNMNLAPVMDVTDPSQDKFLGTRTFGNDAEMVSRMSNEFADGLRSAGILPTAKHFPGHGGVNQDSHTMLPQKNKNLEQLTATDLMPFTRTLKQGPWAVMVAHVAFPKIDPSGAPATFSRVLITELLREKMGFDGLVVTDDIEMGAANTIKDPGERAIKAFEAGADMVMVAWNRNMQTRVVESVFQAVKSGRLPVARIDESVNRIIKVKREFLGFAPPEKLTRKQLDETIKRLDLKQISDRTLATNLRKSNVRWREILAKSDPVNQLLVFASSERFYQSFKSGLEKTKSRFIRISDRGSFAVNRALRANPLDYGVFYVSGSQSAKIANDIEADVASRVVIINTETKSLLKDSARFKHVIDVHFRHPDLGKMSARSLFAPLDQASMPKPEDRTTASTPGTPDESAVPQETEDTNSEEKSEFE